MAGICYYGMRGMSGHTIKDANGYEKVNQRGLCGTYGVHAFLYPVTAYRLCG
jgi:hypothetical protein